MSLTLHPNRGIILLNVHRGEMASYQGRGQGRKGKRYSEGSRQAPTRKTKAAVDRRPNNKMLRQCPPGIVQQLPYLAVPTATRNNHKDNVRSSAVGKQLKQKKSNLQGQLHLPPLDIFWALLRVQHHPPLRRLDPRHAMDSRTHTTVRHGPQRKHVLAKIKSALWTTKWTTLYFLGPQK